jgi:SAM-dependent methyltransferase
MNTPAQPVIAKPVSQDSTALVLRPTETLFIERMLIELYPRLRYLNIPLLRSVAGSLIPSFLLKETPEDTRRIIEIGCGDGLFTNLLSFLFPNIEIIGIDCDPDKIAYARTTINERENLKFICGYANSMPEIPCDRIIYSHCLSNLKSASIFKKLIIKTSRWLVEEGDFFVREAPIRLLWHTAFTGALFGAQRDSLMDIPDLSLLPRVLLMDIGCHQPQTFESPGLPGFPAEVFYRGRPIPEILPDPVLLTRPRRALPVPIQRSMMSHPIAAYANNVPEVDVQGLPNPLDFLFKEEQLQRQWELV